MGDHIMGRTVSWRGAIGRQKGRTSKVVTERGLLSHGRQLNGAHCWPSLEARKSLVVVAESVVRVTGFAFFCFFGVLHKWCMYVTSR